MQAARFLRRLQLPLAAPRTFGQLRFASNDKAVEAGTLYDSFEKGMNSGIIEDKRAKIYGQGWKYKGEDGYAILPTANATLAAVFDGHGGEEAAKFCTRVMLPLLIEDDAFKSGNIREGLHNVFLKMDELMRSSPNSTSYKLCGTTAAVSVVTDSKVFVAHAGDSFSLIYSKDSSYRATQDHSPHVAAEAERAIRAGSVLSPGNRPGNIYSGIPYEHELLMTRALGDLVLKSNEKLKVDEQMCIPVPDVIELDITGDACMFVVLCTDGVARNIPMEQKMPCIIKERILEKDDLHLKGRDDATIVIVELKE